MWRSFLVGLVTGSRSLGPLAAVSVAARGGALASDGGLRDQLARPMVSNSLVQLAVAELVGDKLPGAPDRIIPAGIAPRLLTAAVAGAALAEREQRWPGAALGALGALLATWPSWKARVTAIERFGQVRTGLVEDALVAAAVAAVVPLRRAPTR